MQLGRRKSWGFALDAGPQARREPTPAAPGVEGGGESGESVFTASLVEAALRSAVAGAPRRTAENLFAKHAILNRAAFFQALRDAGIAQETLREYEPIIYRDYCEEHDEERGVRIEGLQRALSRVAVLRAGHERFAGNRQISASELPELLRQFTDSAASNTSLHSNTRDSLDAAGEALSLHASSDSASMKELFERWDMDSSGGISQDEFIVMGLTGMAITSIYLTAGGKGLSKQDYGQVLQKLGLMDTSKVMQGLFLETVFERLDGDGSGTVDLPEFWTGVARLVRSDVWNGKLEATRGWPGWQSKGEALSKHIQELRTGDVVLVRIDDAMGRYLQYSMASPYNHLAVVVRHAARPGVANERTEELLERYPFRRRAHQFCSPGYCRCFSSSWDDNFPPSKVKGGGVSLLESTGEGIHVYDFGHRMFESAYGKGCSVVAVRRLEGVDNRDETARVERFIHSVRGSLYCTHTDELQKAISHEDVTACMDMHEDSTFCSKLVAAFYKHMGWLSSDHSINVMPSDWDDEPNSLARPICLSKGRLGPVEIIHSSSREG